MSGRVTSRLAATLAAALVALAPAAVSAAPGKRRRWWKWRHGWRGAGRLRLLPGVRRRRRGRGR